MKNTYCFIFVLTVCLELGFAVNVAGEMNSEILCGKGTIENGLGQCVPTKSIKPWNFHQTVSDRCDLVQLMKTVEQTKGIEEFWKPLPEYYKQEKIVQENEYNAKKTWNGYGSLDQFDSRNFLMHLRVASVMEKYSIPNDSWLRNEMEILYDDYGNGKVGVYTAECIAKFSNPPKTSLGGGCLIATATYGSELAPQVQQLRELRDNQLLQTASGTSFMNTFNDFYYSFSPTIADWERENPAFKEAVKITLTPLISSLSILNYVDMDSEESVLGYGISLIFLNVGIYFVAPAVAIHVIRKKL